MSWLSMIQNQNATLVETGWQLMGQISPHQLQHAQTQFHACDVFPLFFQFLLNIGAHFVLSCHFCQYARKQHVCRATCMQGNQRIFGSQRKPFKIYGMSILYFRCLLSGTFFEKVFSQRAGQRTPRHDANHKYLNLIDPAMVWTISTCNTNAQILPMHLTTSLTWFEGFSIESRWHIFQSIKRKLHIWVPEISKLTFAFMRLDLYVTYTTRRTMTNTLKQIIYCTCFSLQYLWGPNVGETFYVAKVRHAN